MARMMLNVTIYTRILILCLIPMIALVAVGAMKLIDERERKLDALFVGEVVALAPALSDLVHALQNERGLSAGYLASGGTAFVGALQRQWQDTDTQRAAFDSAFAALPERLQIADIVEPLSRARSTFAGLDTKRAQIQRIERDLDGTSEAYNALIDDLMRVLASMTKVIDRGDLLRPVLSYLGLLQGKEYAGLERAMGAAGFGAGTFEQSVHTDFTRLGAMQDLSFERFYKYATETQDAALRDVLEGSASAPYRDLRQLAEAAPFGGDIQSVDGTAWFEASTSRINGLKGVEGMMIDAVAAMAGTVASRAHTVFWTLAAFLVVLIGLTGVVSAFVVRSIAPPLRRLSRVMRELANNNTDVTIEGAWRGDEIGDMARAVETFRDNALDRMVLEGKAQNDRDMERARQSHIETVVKSFHGTISATTTTVSEQTDIMRGLAERLSGGAQTAAHSASTAHTASDEASSNVQTVAAATEELTVSIREIAGQTHRASALMETASERAASSNADVEQLAHAAERIGTVISLIQDIAEQTNLLALNATIEAARAGEAGKGFAVVASEVKELATQTAKATEEISQQIAGIQASTTGTVDSINAITDAVNEIRDLTTGIAGAVEEQEAATREIANSVGAASTGTETAAQNVAAVTQSIEETAKEAVTVNESADLLSNTSSQLMEEIDAFLSAVTADVQDRRQALRVKMSEVVIICAEGRRRRTTMLDASKSGAKVGLVDDVAVGERVSVELADGSTMVAYVRRQADDGIGLEFVDAIEDPRALIGAGFEDGESIAA